MFIVMIAAAMVLSTQREARPMLHSSATCYTWNGDLMCREDVKFPKCPKMFYDRSVASCRHVMNFFNASNGASVGWWTNSNCTKHRTLCQVDDDHYEDDSYDFTDACDQTVRAEFSYKYSVMVKVGSQTVLVIDHRDGTAVLQPHSEPQVVFSLKYNGNTLIEELLTIHLLQKDANGYITHRSDGAVSNARYSSNDIGLYAQFHRTYRQYDERTHTYIVESQDPIDYRVSAHGVLSQCKEWEDADEKHHHWEYTALGVAIGVIALIAVLSIGCHFYLLKRRAFLAKQIKSHEIQVVEATRVTIPTAGQVVQGVPINVSSDGCEAAPLPPQHGDAIPTSPDQQI